MHLGYGSNGRGRDATVRKSRTICYDSWNLDGSPIGLWLDALRYEMQVLSRCFAKLERLHFLRRKRFALAMLVLCRRRYKRSNFASDLSHAD